MPQSIDVTIVTAAAADVASEDVLIVNAHRPRMGRGGGGRITRGRERHDERGCLCSLFLLLVFVFVRDNKVPKNVVLFWKTCTCLGCILFRFLGEEKEKTAEGKEMHVRLVHNNYDVIRCFATTKYSLL